MSAMKTVWEEINRLLDTTKWTIEEIANYAQVPVSWVNEVVEDRWNNKVCEKDSVIETN